jgi:hypothetical protein
VGIGQLSASQDPRAAPRALRAEQCWNPRPLTNKELVLATLDFLNNKSMDRRSTYTVFSRGERDDSVDPREAIAIDEIPQYWYSGIN